MPKGVALVIGCSTFPTWNTVPGMFASLVTGNPVIIKPHPKAVLPIAIVVAEVQKVLAENGLNPYICQLAVDAEDRLITKDLAENPAVKLIDYTGGTQFGDYVESLKGKTVFTEKTGVNSIILDSCDDLDKVAQNLAFSVSLYSGQMCTAPQNFFIPETGVTVKATQVPYEEVVQKLAGRRYGPGYQPQGWSARAGRYPEPRHPGAGGADGSSTAAAAFWPTAPWTTPPSKTPAPARRASTRCSRARWSSTARSCLARSCWSSRPKTPRKASVWRLSWRVSTAPLAAALTPPSQEIKEQIMDEMSLAGTPVSFNLTGGIYVNQNAGFSDFHVTGGNPAGNASFTNPEFVIKRFTWVGFREPA